MKIRLFLSLVAGLTIIAANAFCEDPAPTPPAPTQPTAPASDNRPFMGKLQPGATAPHGPMGGAGRGGHPGMGGHAGMGGSMMGGMGMGSPHGARSLDEDPHWKVPAGWAEQPPTSVRVGNFVIKGEGAGRQAEVSVIPLPGEAGGKIQNLNLWRSQLGLDPISDAEAAQHLKTAKLGANEVTLVDLTSTEAVNGKFKLRLMAAILPRANYTWFIKMVGDEEVVTKNKQPFLDLISGLTFTPAKGLSEKGTPAEGASEKEGGHS